jgi:rhamnosyltransferase
VTSPRAAVACRPVTIVLSTYNGAQHVAAQLESLRRQSFADWTLLVRDDGSTDETLAIVRRFAEDDPRIRIHLDETPRLRAPGSFGVLLQEALRGGAEYVFTCDQDDVWLDDKVERLLGLMQARERQAGGRSVPLLVHSDLTVVRDDLSVVSESFMRLQKIAHPEKDALRLLLAQNVVTGCAALVNRPLLQLALPMPRVVMHDWWLAQVASACGEIIFTRVPTVLYRQHASNVVGARGYWGLLRGALADLPTWWTGRLQAFHATLEQTDALAKRLDDSACEHAECSRAVVESFLAAFAGDASMLARVNTVRRLRIRPQNRLRRLVYYARVAAAGSRTNV